MLPTLPEKVTLSSAPQFLKSTIPNAADVAGEGNAFERAAVLKSKVPDAVDLAGEGNAFERAAVLKSTVPDAVNIAGEGDTYELPAVRKSIVPDAGDRVVYPVLFDRCRDGDRAGCAASICQCDGLPIIIDRVRQIFFGSYGVPWRKRGLRFVLDGRRRGRFAVRKGGHAAQHRRRQQEGQKTGFPIQVSQLPFLSNGPASAFKGGKRPWPFF